MSTALQRITVSDYLRRERESETKHEFYDGEIFEMPGGSPRHSKITANFIVEAGVATRTGPCDIHSGDLKCKIEATGLYTYPDASIYCEPLRIDADDPAGHTATNPTVLVEVLSGSTEEYDRGTKAYHYRQISSLTDLLLIPQARPQIEHYIRRDSDRWEIVDIKDVESVVRLTGPQIELSVAAIYRGIEFDTPA